MVRFHELAVVLVLSGVAGALLLPGAAESEPTTIGDYQAWSAARFNDQQIGTCYAVSKPVESTPQNVRRGEIYVMVSRGSSGQADELIVAFGYPFQSGATARASIGDSGFDLTTGNEFGWLLEADDVQSLVKAMINGQQMTVKGVSARGTQTVDTYSLLGFTAAYRAILQACK